MRTIGQFQTAMLASATVRSSAKQTLARNLERPNWRRQRYCPSALVLLVLQAKRGNIIS